MYDHNKLYLRPVNELRGTWLIQRLQKPYPNSIENPFTFGGGLVNGGISKEGMKLLSNIFSFDYMGSAEFEWGAVPAAFRFLAEQKFANNIVANVVDVSSDSLKTAQEFVYYVCPKPYEPEVIRRIKLLRNTPGCGTRDSEIQLKEHCGLKGFFDEKDERYAKYAQKNIGWLEIDNGFIFFVDRDVYIKFCNLFGIQLGQDNVICK